MPIHGMLTLADVVESGARGREQHWATQDRAVQQEQLGRQRDMQRVRDGAQQAWASQFKAAESADLTAQQDAWKATGNDPAAFKPQPFKAGDSAMFDAAQAAESHLARNGDMRGWLEHRASIAPIQMQIRQRALGQYRMDNDPVKLLQSFYPTVLDGQQIEKADLMNSPGPDGKSSPARIRVLFKGQSQPVFVDPSKVEATAKTFAMDPTKYMEEEIKFDFMKALKDTENKGRVAVVKEQGKNQMTLADARLQGSIQRDAANNEARGGRVDDLVQGRKDVATIQANGRVSAAGVRSGGANSDASLSLRAAQQERLRIQGKRDDARRTYLAQSKDEYDSKKRAALRGAYDLVVRKLDQEDLALKTRISSIGAKDPAPAVPGRTPTTQSTIDRLVGGDAAPADDSKLWR